MLRSFVLFGFYLLLASCPLDAAEKPDFTGTWNSEGQAVWSITQSGDEIRLTQPGKKTEVVCQTLGAECEAMLDGEKVRTSFWYNGPMLVQLVFADDGKKVTRYRRKLSEDGTQMTVEVTPMAPLPKESDKLVFRRSETTAAR